MIALRYISEIQTDDADAEIVFVLYYKLFFRQTNGRMRKETIYHIPFLYRNYLTLSPTLSLFIKGSDFILVFFTGVTASVLWKQESQLQFSGNGTY